MNDRVTEKDLIFPALILLAQAKVYLKDPNVSTTVLKQLIFEKIEDQLTDVDLEPLKNRNDTKVDQVIRNLVSNKSLEREGLVSYDKENKTLQITDSGFSLVGKKLIEVMKAPKEIREMQQKEIIDLEEKHKSEVAPSRPKMR